MLYDGGLSDSVIEYTPACGSKVIYGWIIYLSIKSYANRMISWPKVSDMSLRQALYTLESVGLTDIKTQNVPSEYPDLVIGIQYKGENLEQGDKIPAGSSLTLLVGDGIPEEYTDSTIDEIPQNAEEAPLTDESWFN